MTLHTGVRETKPAHVTKNSGFKGTGEKEGGERGKEKKRQEVTEDTIMCHTHRIDAKGTRHTEMSHTGGGEK